MKKIITLVLISTLLFSVAPQRLYAADPEDIITDAQIQTIRTHCTDLLATLNRLQRADLLLRYDRGQLYRSTADKLMVPLNQRIASNQLDGSDLLAITAKFNDEYQVFTNSYSVYDTSLSVVLAIDCTKQPTTFYDKLAIARNERSKLHDSSGKLIALAKQYRTQFDTFKTGVVTNNKKEVN